MKSMYLKAFLPLLAATAIGHADQTSTTDTAKGGCRSNESPFHQYHNRVVVLTPAYLAYERTETNAFYAGVEAYVVPVVNTESHKSHHFSKSWRRNFLLDAEVRAGYNYFYNGRDHVTPFLGLGYLQKYHRNHHHTSHHQGILYGAIGARYDHEFTSVFNLGVNGQFLIGGTVTGNHSNHNHKHNHSHHRDRWGTPVVGFDISVPITFRFGYHRHWDVRIEPFDIFLHGSHSTKNYFGFRNTVAYRF